MKTALIQLWHKWLQQRFQYVPHKSLSQKDILIFLYKQGYLYVVLILITFMAGVNYANNLILGFCFLISAVLCISFYLTFKQLHGLNIELATDEIGQVGHSIKLHFYFQQTSVQPRYLYLCVGEQKQKIYLSAQKQQFSFEFFMQQRGQFKFPSIQIYSIYPFGLVRAWTYLYHDYVAWIAPQAADLNMENKHHRESFEPDLDEFRELKSYQMGDSLQAVSWKQAARGQGLYIKVFEQYQDEKTIEIDYAKMPSSSHEEKLQFMMGLVEQCEQQQHAYSMILPHTELAEGLGEAQLNQAKKILAQA